MGQKKFLDENGKEYLVEKLPVSIWLVFAGCDLCPLLADGCGRSWLRRSLDLMIPEEKAPGATAEHKGLHERSFGLDRVHQIVRCPRMQHLSQPDRAKLRMLDRPLQVGVLHILEQNQILLALLREQSDNLLRRCSEVRLWWVWIERIEIPARQKRLEADRKEAAFRVQ